MTDCLLSSHRTARFSQRLLARRRFSHGAAAAPSASAWQQMLTVLPLVEAAIARLEERLGPVALHHWRADGGLLALPPLMRPPETVVTRVTTGVSAGATGINTGINTGGTTEGTTGVRSQPPLPDLSPRSNSSRPAIARLPNRRASLPNAGPQGRASIPSSLPVVRSAPAAAVGPVLPALEAPPALETPALETSASISEPPDVAPPPLQRQLRHSSYRLLDNTLKRRLGQLLQLRLPTTVQIYTSPVADRIVRRLGADAITLGQHILFRSGAYRPGQPAGAALLGHELTHIAQGQAALSATPTQWVRSERQALQNEYRVRRATVAAPPLPPAAAATAPAAPRVPPLPPPSVPRSGILAPTAQADRQMPAAPAPAAAAPDLTRLKEEVFQSLMERLRTDFERGA